MESCGSELYCAQDECATCVNGLCLCLEEDTTSEDEEQVEQYVVERDTNPPVISLQIGDGQMAVTGSGNVVVMHTYSLFSPAFADPGASAYDEEDGDVTDRVSSYGVGSVRMDTATSDEAPYIITYEVTDDAGNSAQVRLTYDLESQSNDWKMEPRSLSKYN